MGIHIMSPLYKMVIVPPAPPFGPPITSTFYPDADPEVTSVDGQVYRVASYPYPWNDVHDGPGTGATPSGDSGTIYLGAYGRTNRWRELRRFVFLFDTSSIPVGSLKTEAEFGGYIYNKSNTFSWEPAVAVFQSNPASNTDLVKADYQCLDAIPLSSAIAYADLVTGAFNIFLLNDQGLDAIIPGGITKLGLREALYDAPDIEPAWESNKLFHIYCYFADKEGIYVPYLKVTYQPPL